MIYNKLPTNWKNLQNKVAKILSDVGLYAEVDKKLETARGKVNIDVFAIDSSHRLKIVYLCECKLWDKKIPQSVVHSFRTVVRDYGANFGIIISKKGFQKGAYAATKNTNLKLFDWYEFQNLFLKQWLAAVTPKLIESNKELFFYINPVSSPRLYRKLPKVKQKLISKLQNKYMLLSTMAITLEFDMLKTDQLKMLLSFLKKKYLHDINIEDGGYEELLGIFSNESKKGIKSFRRLLGKQ